LPREELSVDADHQEVVIRAQRAWRLPSLGELWAHGELITFFVLRDVKVRYRQTLIGVAWVVLQPLLSMVLMTIVFGRLVGLPSDGVPYPLFCFAGLVMWNFITQAVASASASVVANSQLIEKVYFPRLSIPVSAALAALLDFAVAFVLLLLVCLVFGYIPGLRALICLPLALAATVFAAGVGSMLAALSVRYRDINHTVPFLLQLWLFATPVIYPSSLLPEGWRLVAALNPPAGLIETFRWALLDTEVDPMPLLAVSCVMIAACVGLGLLVFGRMERSFADVI
jgi:lipopolysaccharide transport system permease protein